MTYSEAVIRRAAILQLEGIEDHAGFMFPIRISVTTAEMATTTKLIRPHHSWQTKRSRDADLFHKAIEEGIDGAMITRWLERNLSDLLVLSDSPVTTQPLLDRLMRTFEQDPVLRVRDYWPAVFWAARTREVAIDRLRDAIASTLGAVGTPSSTTEKATLLGHLLGGSGVS